MQCALQYVLIPVMECGSTAGKGVPRYFFQFSLTPCGAGASRARTEKRSTDVLHLICSALCGVHLVFGNLIFQAHPHTHPHFTPWSAIFKDKGTMQAGGNNCSHELRKRSHL
jgi:hypothetical protein